MSDSPIPAYRTNLISFALPPQLKDKTMHMFSLSDSGPSEFSVVMSHADAGPDDTLVSFSGRLVTELQHALPQFQLARTQERTLGGVQAIELHYSWRSNADLLHQRQVVALVPGALPDQRQAVLLGATCLRAFTVEWNTAFDAILDSATLRHHDAAAPALAAAPQATTVFALSERRRTLHAFMNHDEACRKTDAREVEQNAWAFFDAAGAPLHPDFIVPGTGTWWRKPGKFVLAARPEMAAAPLRERLSQAAVFVAGSPEVPFASIAEVQAHLDQSVGH